MIRERTEYGVRQRRIGPVVSHLGPVLYMAAFIWRRLLFRTTFIAISGSLGKTTCKECLGTILGSRFPTYRSYRNQNARILLVLNMLRVRPWHRFAVMEVAIGVPDSARDAGRLVRPDVLVMLNVKKIHTKAFKDPEKYAVEKALLLKSLRPGGLAILNGEDPRVAAMADPDKYRVSFFGTSPDFDLWADQISSKWPGRLEFQGHHRTGSVRVRTQLVGTHWLPSCLAALSAALACGVNLETAAEALLRVEPFPGRMQPVRLPEGPIILRDDYNASVDVIPGVFKVLEEAVAGRRVLVITDVSDTGQNRQKRLRHLVSEASRSTDSLVIIGQYSAWGKRRAVDAGMSPDQVHAFDTQQEAAEFLRTELKPADLVMLKGRTTDHITRIFFALLGPVGCWKPHCPKSKLCDICWELGSTPGVLGKAEVVKPRALDKATVAGPP